MTLNPQQHSYFRALPISQFCWLALSHLSMAGSTFLTSPHVTAITNQLDGIFPKALHLLGKLLKPSDGVQPCKPTKRRRNKVQEAKKRDLIGGFFETAFSLVTCVVDATNILRDEVIKCTKDTVDTVKKLQADLTSLLDALNEVQENDQPEPSGSISKKATSTSSESSSSCSLRTVSNCKINCTAVAATTLGVLNKRNKQACTTVCEAPITRCDATGVTSISTATSTTTAHPVCSQGCAA
jgi:hypothetical protein